MGNSKGKKGIILFLMTKFGKSFIENQETREWAESHYFSSGDILQIPPVCGLYTVCFGFVWFILLNYWLMFSTLPCCSSFYSCFCFLFTSFSTLLKWLACTHLGDMELFPEQLVATTTPAKFKDLKFQRTGWKQTRNSSPFEMGV